MSRVHDPDIYSSDVINLSVRPVPDFNVIDVDMFGDITQEAAFRFEIMIDNVTQHFPDIKHISITLCCSGYFADYVLAIVNKLETLKSSGYTISVILTGDADTMSTAICASGGSSGHRYIAPNTTVMFMQLQGYFEGSAKLLKDRQLGLNIQQKFINNLFKDAGISNTTIDELLGGGYHVLTPQQVVSKGFADRVVIRVPRVKAKGTK